MLDRVTTQSQANQAFAYFQQHSLNLARVQNQISSGIKLSLPSDNPSDFAVLQKGKARDGQLDAYLQTISDATGQLNTSVSSLNSISTALNQARQLASQGIDASTDPSAYGGLANEVDAILNSVLTGANSNFDGRYLFGGTSNDAPPFAVAARDSLGSVTAITYSGSDEPVQGLIGTDQTVDTAYAGNRVFQKSGADLFQSLIGLRDDLRNSALTGDARTQALTQRLAQLEKTSATILDTTGKQSADLQNMEAVQTRLQDLKLDIQARNSNLESTDVPSSLVKLRETENLFQSSLAVAARIFDQNLLDFIR